ncbi:ribosome silencing factor [Motiliproteus sp. MSK22-1]|uniref:ribosome silencing factor n=1 Tax=Motiliproteus sp. MSK22-1 TaxID=1897630 RepID=UPI0009762000|nr:ribosome silencing factor [Motiliproteus sp. MSK22-1]OMH33732.1 ribosome silencing factor [Motiliproteus sp. MSK22-1]
MQTKKLIKLVSTALEDLKARDIVLLDVRGKCSVTDYMLIASGSSNRHVKAVAENVVAEAKKAGVELVGTEGLDSAEWALVDLGDVVVHVMQPESRALYDLERLWGTDALEEA